MKKIFEKHETLFCILLIVIYIIFNTYCKNNFGMDSYKTVIANTIFSLLLIGIMIILKRVKYYGLTKVKNKKKYLYFIPLLVLGSVNLWNGINITSSTNTMILHVLLMINIGFIEEVIFRGFLFKMMEKDNLKSAIIVSSITFGLGHIVNLFSGADLVSTLIQIIYAIAIGYVFVIVFYRSKSIVPCIVSHILINAFTIFNIENTFSIYIVPIFMVVLCLGYAWYINKHIKAD